MNTRDTVPAPTLTVASSLRLGVLLALISLATAAVGQTTNLPRIGWVTSGTPENSRYILEAIHAGLADESLVDGRVQARYAAKMIRGAKPSDLPIDQARASSSLST